MCVHVSVNFALVHALAYLCSTNYRRVLLWDNTKAQEMYSLGMSFMLFHCACEVIVFVDYVKWFWFQFQIKHSSKALEKDEEDDGLAADDEEDGFVLGETLCAKCEDTYASDEFWIRCGICERWFHGKCLRITPAKAEHIEMFKCRSCRKARNQGLRSTWWIFDFDAFDYCIFYSLMGRWESRLRYGNRFLNKLICM